MWCAEIRVSVWWKIIVIHRGNRLTDGIHHLNSLRHIAKAGILTVQKSTVLMCGNKGVCVVENIAALDISGVDKERQYYILKPKYQS